MEQAVSVPAIQSRVTLLPIGDVPELLIDSVGGASDDGMGQRFAKSFEDMRRRSVCAVCNERPGEFIHLRNSDSSK